MAFELKNLTQIAEAPFDTIIDVRAPSEFAEDHLPGAISMPVLTDEERARVGTIYKQDSPFKARKIGAALVARNAARHLEESLVDKPGDWRPLVYCWRGGQRSGSFASILAQVGWRTEVLAGGYRTYRRAVSAALYDTPMRTPVILLDGNTGTGKTEILQRLRRLGIQTLDLEALAGHRGSALGGLGAQPSQKGFETRLAMAMTDLNSEQPVVIEAESSRVGRINIPARLFAAMRDAPRVEMRVPVDARARYLALSYADSEEDVRLLDQRMERLVSLQGRAQVEAWQAALREGRLTEVARSLMEKHYDPRYAKVRGGLGAGAAHSLDIAELDSEGLDRAAAQLAVWVRQWSKGQRPEAVHGQ